MISLKEKRNIKKLFGPGYIKKITDLVNELGFRNSKDEEFKGGSVSDVLNGRSHSVLEDAIRQAWNKELRRRENQLGDLIKRTRKITA